MKIYHFCSAKDAKKIRKQGIKLGGVCVFRPVKSKKGSVDIYTGFQWLTLDPEKKN